MTLSILHFSEMVKFIFWFICTYKQVYTLVLYCMYTTPFFHFLIHVFGTPFNISVITSLIPVRFENCILKFRDIILKKDFLLFERQHYREQERQRDLQCTSLLPKDLNAQRWPTQCQESRASCGSPTQVQVPNTWTTLHCFRKHISRGWAQKWSSQDMDQSPLWDGGTTGRGLIHHTGIPKTCNFPSVLMNSTFIFLIFHYMYN